MAQTYSSTQHSRSSPDVAFCSAQDHPSRPHRSEQTTVYTLFVYNIRYLTVRPLSRGHTSARQARHTPAWPGRRTEASSPPGVAG
eukprot:1524381-Prymnesium_polylepis.1